MQKTGTRLFNVVYIGQLEDEWGAAEGMGLGKVEQNHFHDTYVKEA